MKTAIEPVMHHIPNAFKLTASGGNGEGQKKILELAMQMQLKGIPHSQALELAAGEHTARILEQADMAFEGHYNQAAGTNPIRRHVLYKPATGGFAEFGDLYPTGTMLKKGAVTNQNDAVRNPWQSAVYRLVPELWWWTGEIDHTVMRRLESITDGGFTRSLMQAAQLPVQTEIDEFIRLLDANTAAHMGATSAFFSATNPIPRTDRTFSNKIVNAITTVAEVRTAVRKMQSAMMKMRGAMGMAVHGYKIDDKDVTLIAHPDKAELIEDAFEPGNIGGPNVVLNDKARMPNWERVYHDRLTSTKLIALVAGNYPALAAAQGEMPNMISTINVPGNLMKILSNAELAQVRHEFKPGYGSPFSALLCDAS